MSLVWSAYRTLSAGIGSLAPHGRWLVGPAERELWTERLGRVQVPGGVHAWIHAASMGESLAAAALVDALRRRQPDARFQLTATTRGGRTRLRALDADARLAPLDAPQTVGRFFAGVHPARVFVIETELWFQWLLRARRERVPVAILSARLSARSLARYRRFGRPLGRLVADLAAVLCQSETDAERWRALGARGESIAVVGNLKADALPRPVTSRRRAREALELDPERPLLVLGNVRPGEVARLARAWAALRPAQRNRWQVVAVPRHPAASAELREEARAHAATVVTAGVPSGGAWRWDDRLGVLVRYYQACEVAFVGGSLVPRGGHNPLEPAAAGAAVLMGAHYRAQIPAVRALAARDALWIVRDENELGSALQTLLDDPIECSRRATAAVAVADAERGAAERAVERLVAWSLWPAA